MPRTIRPERTWETYSRGLALVRAIRALWEKHRRLPAGSNQTIETNILDLMTDFDLTFDEWYYWTSIIK